MSSLISVVIPVYNVEKYLCECLDSIVNQTYKNLQIILVDDGSTDKSGEICDEYAKKDERITVVHQKNAGAGAAKNAGLDLIKGSYFSIIDSDDYIELDMYEKMISYMLKYKVDIVQCLFRKVFVNGFFDRGYAIPKRQDKKIKAQQFLAEYLYDWKYAVFWNKLFKTELLNNIRFPENRKIDDEFFTYKLVCNANAVFNAQDVFYNYRIRKSSVMNETKRLRLISDKVDCFAERYNYVTKKFPKLKKQYYYDMADKLIYFENMYGKQDFITNEKKFFLINNINLIDKISMKLMKIKTMNDYNPDEKNKECFD